MLERSCEIYAAANAVDAYLCTPFPQFCVVTLRGEHGIATKLAWFVFSIKLEFGVGKIENYVNQWIGAKTKNILKKTQN